MSHKRLWLLACLLVLPLTGTARAQTYVPLAAGAGGGNLPLVPVADVNTAYNPLFADAAGITGLNLQAQVAGRGSANVNNAYIGFDFLRPFWTHRDFLLAVPTGSVGSFPLLGNIGHVDDHFALVPNIKYKYDVSDIGLSVNASGTFLNLSGHLTEQIVNPAGQGLLTASSSLTIIVANLPEVSSRLYYDELVAEKSHLHCSWLDDLVIDVGVGTRYSSINQNYTGQLTNTLAGGPGNNMSQRYSTQSFQGIGLTTRADFLFPVKQDWVLFTNFRASVLVGENNRESSLTVNVAGTPGMPATLSQSRTEFIPVVEMETGVVWGFECGDRLRFGHVPPFCTIRVAGVLQFWGDVGPLSAGSLQGFQTSNLFLAGVHVLVGIHR